MPKFLTLLILTLLLVACETQQDVERTFMAPKIVDGVLPGEARAELFDEVALAFLLTQEYRARELKWFVDWGELTPPQDWLERKSPGFQWLEERPQSGELYGQILVSSSWKMEDRLVRVRVIQNATLFHVHEFKCQFYEGEWWVKRESSGMSIAGCFQDEDD